MLAVKLDGTVRLLSRRGSGHTRRWPQLVKAIAALPQRTLILERDEQDLRPLPLRERREVLELAIDGFQPRWLKILRPESRGG